MLRWLRRLPVVFGRSRELVGKDANGNKYYNLNLDGRVARIVDTAGDEDDYDPHQVPVEWQCKAALCIWK